MNLLRITRHWLRVRGGSRNVRRVLFAGDTPMNYIVFRPVHEWLKADSRVEIYFSSHLPKWNEVRGLYSQFGIYESRIIDPHVARRARFDLFLTPIRICLGRRARRKVKMFHGVSFKGKHFQSAFGEFDSMICPGPYLKRIFESQGGFAKNDPRLIVAGYPKTDSIFDGSFDRVRLLGELGLDPGLPTVLYAPTWGAGNSLERMGEAILRGLGSEPLNLIVKLHDHERGALKHMEPLAGPRTRFARGFDSTPYLFAADLLISDASSVTNEFTLLDRPIVFCKVPDLLARYPHNHYDMEMFRGMGRWVDTAEELLQVVREGLARPEVGREVRRSVARDLFHDPGRATFHTVGWIYDWLGLDWEGRDEWRKCNPDYATRGSI